MIDQRIYSLLADDGTCGLTSAFAVDLSVLESAPSHWERRPLWTLIRRRDVTGRPDAELLSVYRDHGIVPKSSRDDNFNKPSEDLSTYRYVRAGDLVLNKMKTWQGSLAVSQYEGIVSPAYYVCSLSSDVDPQFAHHLLRSTPYIHLYQAASQGIRPNQWDLPFEEFQRIPMLLPPLDEQRRIADFLDAETTRVDHLLTATNQQLELLGARRIELLRALTTGTGHGGPIKATAIPWMPAIAGTWQLYKVGRSFQTASGTTPRASDDRFFEGPNPWINTGDLRDGPIERPAKSVSDAALREYPALRIYPSGTLMVAMYGATIGRVGITTGPACVNQACCALLSQGGMDTTYTFYWFLSHRAEIMRLATGGGQPNISQDLIRSLQIPGPRSVAEQKTIVAECERIEKDVTDRQALLSQRAALLRERRQALITAAVTGGIAV